MLKQSASTTERGAQSAKHARKARFEVWDSTFQNLELRASRFRCAEMVFPQPADSVSASLFSDRPELRLPVAFHSRGSQDVRTVPSH
jgi:hypothetical protein